MAALSLSDCEHFSFHMGEDRNKTIEITLFLNGIYHYTLVFEKKKNYYMDV